MGILDDIYGKIGENGDKRGYFRRNVHKCVKMCHRGPPGYVWGGDGFKGVCTRFIGEMGVKRGS